MSRKSQTRMFRLPPNKVFVMSNMGNELTKYAIANKKTLAQTANAYINSINAKGPHCKNNLVSATDKWVNNLAVTTNEGFECSKAPFISFYICNHTSEVIQFMQEKDMCIKQAAEEIMLSKSNEHDKAQK